MNCNNQIKNVSSSKINRNNNIYFISFVFISAHFGKKCQNVTYFYVMLLIFILTPNFEIHIFPIIFCLS